MSAQTLRHSNSAGVIDNRSPEEHLAAIVQNAVEQHPEAQHPGNTLVFGKGLGKVSVSLAVDSKDVFVWTPLRDHRITTQEGRHRNVYDRVTTAVRTRGLASVIWQQNLDRPSKEREVLGLYAKIARATKEGNVHVVKDSTRKAA